MEDYPHFQIQPTHFKGLKFIPTDSASHRLKCKIDISVLFSKQLPSMFSHILSPTGLSGDPWGSHNIGHYI